MFELSRCMRSGHLKFGSIILSFAFGFRIARSQNISSPSVILMSKNRKQSRLERIHSSGVQLIL
jgi:hypothetical protein